MIGPDRDDDVWRLIVTCDLGMLQFALIMILLIVLSVLITGTLDVGP